MKALIVGLLSLTILSTSATAAQVAGLKVPPVFPAGVGFCNKHDGIFVILVTDKLLNDKGGQIAFVCPKIGSKDISQLPEPLNSDLVEVNDINLGEAKLLFFPDQPETCIVWTIGSTMLSTSTCATSPPPVKVDPVSPAAAVTGFCKKYDGMYVIVVNDKGDQEPFVCPKIKGKGIKQLTTLPPGPFDELITTPLGTAKKLKLLNDPDPCIVYTIGGTRYAFCW
jgi:hypothetical protein